MRKKTTTKASRALGGSKVTPRPRATAPTNKSKRETVELRFFTEDGKYRRDLRDVYAAAAVMGGFHEYLTAGDTWSSYDDFAESCFNMADAMMRVREKRDGK